MIDLVSLLEINGPVLGREVVRLSGMDSYSAWKRCCSNTQIAVCIVGKRYLRLDKKIDGYARLSPSIMREFLNYTAVGTIGMTDRIVAAAQKLEQEIADTSQRKFILAQDTIHRLVESHREGDLINENCCFMISGDVAYRMAHAEPRPESSTGELVKGSDLDIVAIVGKHASRLPEIIDDLLYREKFNLLHNPASKEEIDYVVKDLKTVEEQLRFNNFKAMVASKILHEGVFLYGSFDLYCRIRENLNRHGIPDKLQQLENKARVDRDSAEYVLLSSADDFCCDDLMGLFYTTEEKEEIF